MERTCNFNIDIAVVCWDMMTGSSIIICDFLVCIRDFVLYSSFLRVLLLFLAVSINCLRLSILFFRICLPFLDYFFFFFDRK